MGAEVTEHATAVAEALRNVERRLKQLVDSIAHSAPRVSTREGGSAAAQLRQVCDAYATIDLEMEDEPNQSVVCLAVIGASRDIVRLAEATNGAKALLKATCVPLQGRRVRVPVRDPEGLVKTKAVPLTRVILRSLQRSDLNLLAAYRKIPILEVKPARIVYTEAQTRSVYRKSRSDILDMLENSEKPGAAEDRARVRAARDRWFALVRERYANFRANVWFEGLDRRGRGRVQLAAELPLMFALGQRGTWPEIAFPEPTSGSGQGAPSRARIGRLESVPFLTSAAIYRYRR